MNILQAGSLRKVGISCVSLKQNWNKPPLVDHKFTIKMLILIWAILVIWMLILGINPLIILIVPGGSLTLMYLLVRLGP